MSKFILNEVKEFLSDWHSNSNVISVQTSGSTGTPKLIHLSKKGLLYSARNTNSYFDLDKTSKALMCLPLSTIGGKMMLVRALESKMQLHVQEASSNPLRSIVQNFDFIAVTPMQLTNMLNESLENIRGIKSILVGGAPMNENLISQLINEKITVFHGYGMSETASHVAIKKIGFQSDQYYQAMPGIHFEYGENKTLKIHYPALWEIPIQTTDVVELVDEFQFKWLGRNDFVVNSGGVKLHVEEIENQLSKLIKFPFFVFGIPDNYLGEKLILCIETSLQETIYDFEFLGIKKPREVFYLNSFKYTMSGKIDRKATVKLLKF